MCLSITPTWLGRIRFGQNDHLLHAGLSSVSPFKSVACCDGVNPTAKFHFALWQGVTLGSDIESDVNFFGWLKCEVTNQWFHTSSLGPTKTPLDTHELAKWQNTTRRYELITKFPTSSLDFRQTNSQHKYYDTDEHLNDWKIMSTYQHLNRKIISTYGM